MRWGAFVTGLTRESDGCGAYTISGECARSPVRPLATLDKMALRFTLYALVLFGLWGSARLAWQQLSIGEACPAVGSVPACYVALAGYSAMTGGLVLVGRWAWARRLFFAGVAIAGGLAMIGSILELVDGPVCPRAGSVPTCYISLGLAGLIGLLFWWEYLRPAAPGTRAATAP